MPLGAGKKGGIPPRRRSKTTSTVATDNTTIPFRHLLSADPVPTTPSSTHALHLCQQAPTLFLQLCQQLPPAPFCPSAHYLCPPTGRCTASCRKTTSFIFSTFSATSTSMHARNSTTTILINIIGSTGVPFAADLYSSANVPLPHSRIYRHDTTW